MKRLVLLTALLLAVAGCHEKQPEDVVLARIDEAGITAEEVQLNYEFGHGHLRRGDDPRRAYLHYMIFEKVLALEAEKSNLDTAQAVIHAMHTLREELLIERVFEEKALANVEVTDEEIRDEINRTAVSFQFRFLPARSEEAARTRYDQMLEQEYEAVLAANREEFAELNLSEENLKSPFLKAEEIEPAILDVLKDLEINTPSEPVRYQGQWYLFEVVAIERQPLGEADYAQKAPTYRKVLYNKKAMELATAFVAETMEPLQVVTRRQGFEILNEALWAWYRHETPVRNLLHYIEEQGWDTTFTDKLVDNYEAPLVQFDDQNWTIRTFLEHFTPGRYSLRAREPEAFKARLADVVALVVRDAVFLDMAEEERLHEQPQYQRSLALWKDKWMFQEYRKILLDSTAITEAEVKAYYEQKDEDIEGDFYPYDRLSAQDKSRIKNKMMQESLAQYVDSVSAFHDIVINETMLDTLPLNVSTVNPYMTVHLLKSNSNKMPFPIVDPNWKSGTGQ